MKQLLLYAVGHCRQALCRRCQRIQIRILIDGMDIAAIHASRQQLNYNLMCSGFGALLTTDANIATMPSNPKCLYFVLGGPAAEQSFSIAYPLQPSQIITDFVTTAKDLYACQHPLKQLVNE